MRVFITGTAGFIGFHIARLLLAEGATVHGYDGFTDYYDLKLKRDRHAQLEGMEGYSFTRAMLEDNEACARAVRDFAPDIIVHLAAQAGVRYSLENPRAYIDSNLTGTFNVMDAAREAGVRHLLMASTSSVYGANTSMPFSECDKADTPLTIYAATKKANEAMGHAYAHLWNLPTTMFRFFTVYGPWGRPDMALFRFVKAIEAGEPIDVYNNGDMARDFTYVDDLVEGLMRLRGAVPGTEPVGEIDSLSPVAPFRVVNVGNGSPVPLMEFVSAVEAALDKRAEINFMDMQPGDVPATWADASLLQALVGALPKTPLEKGVRRFVEWYRDYY